MKRIQLYIENTAMLGSDGVMKIDGRFNIQSLERTIIERNERFSKNFPHKVADGYKLLDSRLNEISNLKTL